MDAETLTTLARELVAEGKGILAADESSPTCTKRFEARGIASTPESRRDYRELLFGAPDLGRYVSGAILYDETLRQKSAEGEPLPKLLERQGIRPGIKVDTGAKPLPGTPEEKITEGLDGLPGRLEEYAGLGARFTKWRAVIAIGDGLPSARCIRSNARALARYARIAQEAGFVPIVEPEVLMEGAHDAARCEEVSTRVLREVFQALGEEGALLEGLLLKPNMAVAGQGARAQAGVDEVAARTLRVLRRAVPAAVPGVVFLSGGQSAELATRHLNALNAAQGPKPWRLSFSFARALQEPALERWQGRAGNREAAQRALVGRARLNAQASLGRYRPGMEEELEAA